MKYALIYPGISWSGFNSFGKDLGGEANFIHHGMGTIASYLKKFGHDCDFIDLRRLKNWSDFTKTIKNTHYSVYGISSTTVDFDYSIKAARIIKKIYPHAVVVVGGVHPTVRPTDALKIKEFTYIVVGEGEKAMLQIINAQISKKKLPRLIKGLSCQLEEIPHIDRDLFNHHQGEMIHPFVSDLPIPFATIMSSRGCPFNCTFCQPAERLIFGGVVRLREMSDVVDEIKEINRKYGLKSFLIHDDLFIISKERINKFVRLYKKSGVKAVFMCQARADLVIRFQNEIKKLAEIGLIGIMIGFESGSQRILKFINKQTTVEDNLKAAEICHHLGIKIWANYMLGIPSETYSEMWQTVRMIRKINPEYYSPSLFTPYPQTGLYDYCQERNLLLFTHFSDYRRSLKGDKIRGFNYNFIRILIFLYMPFKLKINIFRYLLK